MSRNSGGTDCKERRVVDRQIFVQTALLAKLKETSRRAVELAL